MAQRENYDAIVIGSGLAGLTAALHLQRGGVATLVLERRPVPGGLCGTFTLDGYEFVTGCNDFGRGLVRELTSLGVDIAFHHPKTWFQFGRHRLLIPPNLGTAWELVRRAPRLLQVIRRARRTPQQSMGELIDTQIADPLVADLSCLLVYGMLRSPDDVAISEIQGVFAKELDYGYDKSCTPVGGPKRMIAAMVRRFEALGGEMSLSNQCLGIESEGAGKLVRTTNGVLRARAVLSSQGRGNEYPAGTKRGLEAAFLLLALDKSFPYPPNVHTIGWFPQGLAQQLRQLDRGQPVAESCFHVFRSDLPPQPDHYTINAIIPMPRGERDPGPERRQALTEYMLSRLERLLPNVRAAIRYSYFLSPAEYEQRLGLCCAPSLYVAPAGHPFTKPPSYDPGSDVHFLGTSVEPVGEHAGAAALSGKLAAARVMRTSCAPSRSA